MVAVDPSVVTTVMARKCGFHLMNRRRLAWKLEVVGAGVCSSRPSATALVVDLNGGAARSASQRDLNRLGFREGRGADDGGPGSGAHQQHA